jgi:hypothetical protein
MGFASCPYYLVESLCVFCDSEFRELAPDIFPLGVAFGQQNFRTFCQGSSISLVCLHSPEKSSSLKLNVQEESTLLVALL